MTTASKQSKFAFSISAMIAIAFMVSTLVTPLYPLFQTKFGFSEITLTLIYAVYVAGNLGALVFFGRVSDQIGRKRASLPALVLAAVGTVLFIFSSSVAWLFWARFITGFAVGICSGVATAWLRELYDRERSMSATTTATLANMCGVAAGPLVAGLLGEYTKAPLKLPFLPT